MGQENWKELDLEGEKRTPHAARFLGRVEVPLFHLGVPFRLIFDSDTSSYPKTRQYIPPLVELIPHREFSHDLCFVYSFCQVFQAMTSVDSYQCTSMDDDDDELEDNYEEKKKKEWWAEYEKKGE